MSELTDFGSDIIDNLTDGYTLLYQGKIMLYNIALKRSVFLWNECYRCSLYICYVNQNGLVRLKQTLFLSGVIRWWYDYCLEICLYFFQNILIRDKTVPMENLSWRRSLSYRNQSIHLFCESMNWFLYDKNLLHERVNLNMYKWSFTIKSCVLSWNYQSLTFNNIPVAQVNQKYLGMLLDNRRSFDEHITEA